MGNLETLSTILADAPRSYRAYREAERRLRRIGDDVCAQLKELLHPYAIDVKSVRPDPQDTGLISVRILYEHGHLGMLLRKLRELGQHCWIRRLPPEGTESGPADKICLYLPVSFVLEVEDRQPEEVRELE